MEDLRGGASCRHALYRVTHYFTFRFLHSPPVTNLVTCLSTDCMTYAVRKSMQVAYGVLTCSLSWWKKIVIAFSAITATETSLLILIAFFIIISNRNWRINDR
jgi:hypothetical protein